MKKSRIARPIAAVEPPAVRSLPLVALLVDTKAALFDVNGLARASACSTTMLEEDRTALCGPRLCASASACRVPCWHGAQVVLGGR